MLMKFLVVSDSHNITNNLKKLLTSLCDEIDGIIHLGDGAEDIMYLSKKYKCLEVFVVRGNCDFNAEIDKKKIFSLNDKKILITHGDLYDVKYTYENIILEAKNNNVDACFFGHSHIPIIFQKDSINFMNPGSISFPRNHPKASYGMLTINNSGELNLSISYIA